MRFKCESSSPFAYFLIGDDSLALITSLSTGLDPEVSFITTYELKSDTLVVKDFSSDGKEIDSVFLVNWYGKDKLILTEADSNYKTYLYREED